MKAWKQHTHFRTRICRQGGDRKAADANLTHEEGVGGSDVIADADAGAHDAGAHAMWMLMVFMMLVFEPTLNADINGDAGGHASADAVLLRLMLKLTLLIVMQFLLTCVHVFKTGSDWLAPCSHSSHTRTHLNPHTSQLLLAALWE